MDQYEQYNQPQQAPPIQPPKTNGKAIASLVLGIISITPLGFVPILGILAIIFASLAFTDIKRRYEDGRGLAVAGLVCGIISTVFYGSIILIGIIQFVAAPSSSIH